MNDDMQREAFEVWATVKRRYNLTRYALRPDEYEYYSTDRALEAFRAGYEAGQQAAIRHVRENVKEGAP